MYNCINIHKICKNITINTIIMHKNKIKLKKLQKGVAFLFKKVYNYYCSQRQDKNSINIYEDS